MSSSIPSNASSGAGASQGKRGRLQVFLGYAAGVGKTYRMLEDAQELKRAGKDIVVGYFESHGRKDTIARTVGLEMIPNKIVDYRGVQLRELDTAAILRRHPAICAVDELPHTNVPGSSHVKRWEDVQELLDAGIDVMTTMNIQHLESLNDQIFHVTGIRVRETVPDWLVKSAAEVVMVDATTEALLNRLKRGVIYAPEKAQRAMENFFKESTLASLRELALRQTAHELEVREIAETAAPAKHLVSAPFAEKSVHDRILIYVTANASTAVLIRRGRRMADYLSADCFAVCVVPGREDKQLVSDDHDAIEKHLNFARTLHIDTRILEGQDPAESLVDFARRNQITQILLGRPKYHLWDRLLGTDLILRVVRSAKDVRVIIVAERHRPTQPAAV
ncbi:MAG: sensor histidine kinase KdpD [Candidatus Acidiferrales bacterium]